MGGTTCALSSAVSTLGYRSALVKLRWFLSMWMGPHRRAKGAQSLLRPWEPPRAQHTGSTRGWDQTRGRRAQHEAVEITRQEVLLCRISHSGVPVLRPSTICIGSVRQAPGTVTFERTRHDVPADYADAFAVTVLNHSGLTGAMRTADFDTHTTSIRGEEDTRQKSSMFAPGEAPSAGSVGPQNYKVVRLGQRRWRRSVRDS